MNTTRRDFLKYCGMSAAALGLTMTDMLSLEEALANPNGPSVLWLQGSSARAAPCRSSTGSRRRRRRPPRTC